jgi:hypothetical protein
MTLADQVESAESLPTTNLEWMNYFFAKLKAYEKDKNKSLKAAKALFEVLLTFQVDGKIIFAKDGICGKIKVPTFNQCAKFTFEEAKDMKCTLEDKRLYCQFLAYLMKKGYTLLDLIPDSWLEEEDNSWLSLFTENENMKQMEMVTKTFRESQQHNLTRMQNHSFIILWCFWYLSKHNEIKKDECTDLIGWNEILKGYYGLEQFISVS